MKRLLLSSLAGLILTSGSALAADLGPAPAPAYKALPPPVVITSWTGCYLAAGFGYGVWNQDHYAETSGLVPISGSTTDGGRGWVGRFGAGCDYQTPLFDNRVVIGAFGDYDWMNLKGTSDLDLTSSTTPFFGIAGNENETGAWYVGARIGYLVTPRLLSYVDGGYTQTRFDQVNYVNNDDIAFPRGSATGLSMPATTYHGWFVGGGTEYALDMDWIPIRGLFWRNEYRYSSYSSADVALSCAGGGAQCGAAGPVGVSVHDQKQVQTITSSLVWRFNFEGPIATRY